MKVKRWAYVLQGPRLAIKEGPPLTIDQIIDTPYDLTVIDYSGDGSHKREFRRKDIERLQKKGKIVLAYMSIGEASDFRFYFRILSKNIIESPNPDWPGAYKVRYWLPEWQKFIYGKDSGFRKSWLDRILDAGFDGVYLDIVDAYLHFGPKEMEGSGERLSAADDMVELISGLSTYAKKRNPHFFVFPQNGSSLFHHSKKTELYFNSIDGIGQEDLFFFGSKKMDNSLNPQKEVIENLLEFKKRGKLVLVIDYIRDIEKIKKFYELCHKHGFIPTIGSRELDGTLLPHHKGF